MCEGICEVQRSRYAVPQYWAMVGADSHCWAGLLVSVGCSAPCFAPRWCVLREGEGGQRRAAWTQVSMVRRERECVLNLRCGLCAIAAGVAPRWRRDLGRGSSFAAVVRDLEPCGRIGLATATRCTRWKSACRNDPIPKRHPRSTRR